MHSRLRKGYAAVAVMAIAIALLIVSMTAPVASTTTDFSIFNSGWNGTSDLAVLTYSLGKFAPSFEVRSTGTGITVEQTDLTHVALDPIESALVIIGPTNTFTSAEGSHVGDFVRSGGVLLLADDFGAGNSLLERMGATTRFSGDLVMDLAYEKQPEFSVLFDIKQDPLTKNVSTLLLNYPSSLSINTATTEAIAQSSIASWLDANGNRVQEWGEERGPFPIVAREHMGLGEILLVSDPSIFINGMRQYMDNIVFANNTINQVCLARTAVYFDESHRKFLDPVSITMEFTGDVSTNAKAIMVSMALVLTLWISTNLVDRAFAWSKGKTVRGMARIIDATRQMLFKRKKETPPEPANVEEMFARLSKEHPEWRVGLLRYMLRQRERHRKLLEEK
jgi:hypothetical protein